MIIWETINGQQQPVVFCDICGWRCVDDEYEEIDGIVMCPNCIQQNSLENHEET